MGKRTDLRLAGRDDDVDGVPLTEIGEAIDVLGVAG